MIYSITSSARASSVGGTSRPSIRALWTLMTSSNLLDCTTGRPGAVEDAPGIDAQMTPGIRQVGSVAHQPAGFGNFTRRGCHGNRVARRHGG